VPDPPSCSSTHRLCQPEWKRAIGMGECLLGSLVINLLALLKHQFGHHSGRHPTSSKLPDPIVFPGRRYRYGDGNGTARWGDGLGRGHQGGPLVGPTAVPPHFRFCFYSPAPRTGFFSSLQIVGSPAFADSDSNPRIQPIARRLRC